MMGDRPGGFPHAAQEGVRQSTAPSNTYRYILLAVKVIFGLALLVLSLRGIQFTQLLAGLRSANLFWLALSLILVLLGLGLKLWRWQVLVNKYHIRVGLPRLFSAYFVGQAANILLPLRGGELIRLGYFAEAGQLLPEAASTILIEKYLDILALSVCSVLVSFRFSLDNIYNLRGWLLPLTLVATVVLLLFIFLFPALWGRVRHQAWLSPRLVPWLDRWVQAGLWLQKPSQWLPLVSLTLFIWLVMWSTNLLLFNSLELPLGSLAGGLVLVMVYLGLLPALMPGNIGPFYFFASLALLPFGILHGQAITFAVVLHAIVTLPPLLAGGVGLLLRSKPPLHP